MPWVILDRLEKPVLLMTLFHYSAYAISRERCRLRIDGLHNVDFEVFRRIFVLKMCAGFRPDPHHRFSYSSSWRFRLKICQRGIK